MGRVSDSVTRTDNGFVGLATAKFSKLCRRPRHTLVWALINSDLYVVEESVNFILIQDVTIDFELCGNRVLAQTPQISSYLLLWIAYDKSMSRQ